MSLPIVFADAAVTHLARKTIEWRLRKLIHRAMPRGNYGAANADRCNLMRGQYENFKRVGGDHGHTMQRK